jgi:hypothetical protein
MHSGHTQKFECIRVGEGSGSHDPFENTFGERGRDRSGDPLLARQVVWILDEAVICRRVGLAILSATPGKFAELWPHLRPLQWK